MAGAIQPAANAPDRLSGPAERAAGDHAGQVVAPKDRGNELAAAVYAGSVEHGFQVILHGVSGQVQPFRDLPGRITAGRYGDLWECGGGGAG